MSVGLCLFVYIDIATTEIIHITDNCSSFSRAKYFDVTRFPMSDVATPAIIIYIYINFNDNKARRPISQYEQHRA